MKSIDDVVHIIKETGRGKRLIVFVCGFGGAGKTTFCRRLSDALDCPSIVFETDWYAKYATEERREKIRAALASQDQKLIEQEENPMNWYDWSALVAGLENLKQNGRLEIRDGWSQLTGNKELSQNLELPDSEESVIICDGIYLLHDDVKATADLIVLLNTQVSACLARSASRDSHRSSEEYLFYKAALVEKYDKPYFKQFGSNAHITVSAGDMLSQDILTEDEFWSLIDKARGQAQDDSELPAKLTSIISKLSEDQVLAFGSRFDYLQALSYTSELWCAAYVACGGCSDDSFDYFRAWLTGRGKVTFYNALENPDSLLDVFKELAEAGEVPDNELMLSVAQDAYEAQTGKEDYWTRRDLSFDLTGNPKDRATMQFNWTEDDPESMKKICPNVFDYFWEEPLG